MKFNFEKPQIPQAEQENGAGTKSENTHENKEGYAKPISIIYRNNPKWEAQIPLIRQHIESQGGQLDIHSFPQGTEQELIEKWLDDNKDQFKDKILISDTTCTPRNDFDRSDSLNLDGVNSSFADDQIKKLIPESASREQRTEAQLALVIENMQPQKIVILESKLIHHIGKLCLGMGSEEFIQKIIINEICREDIRKDLSKMGIEPTEDAIDMEINDLNDMEIRFYPNIQSEANRISREFLEERLSSIHYPPENTISFEKPEDVEEFLEEKKDHNILYIVDGHNGELRKKIRESGNIATNPVGLYQLLDGKIQSSRLNNAMATYISEKIDENFKKKSEIESE